MHFNKCFVAPRQGAPHYRALEEATYSVPTGRVPSICPPLEGVQGEAESTWSGNAVN